MDASRKLINQQPAYDQMLNAEVQMQVNDTMQTGVVKRRSIGLDGKLAGKYGEPPC